MNEYNEKLKPMKNSESKTEFKDSFEPSDESQEISNSDEFSPIEKNQVEKDNQFFPFELEKSKVVNKDQDNRHLSKKIGDYSEIKVIESLIESEKNVLVPFGDNQKFDLLFEEKNKFHPVQVKTAHKKKESFPLKNIKKNSYIDQVSYFGIYERETENTYLIPTKELYNSYNEVAKLDENSKKLFKIRKSRDITKNRSLQKTIQMISQRNTVFCEMDKGIDENFLYYKSKDPEQKIHKYNESNNFEYKTRSHKTEIYSLNIAADLMNDGYIISRPILSGSIYDYVIQKKYNTDSGNRIKKFEKVKVVKNFQEICDIDKSIEYGAVYNRLNDRSFLIPNETPLPSNVDKYLIKRNNNCIKKMSDNDLGDAMELRIGAEFEKDGYKVYYPVVGRDICDLVVKDENQFHTVQVKTGNKYKEKDSNYFRFDTSTIQNYKGERIRKTYKGKVDFICSVDRDTLKSYIVPADDVPRIGVKLKLDDREDARYIHRGTKRAKDYEFSNVKQIISDYQKEKLRKLKIYKRYKEIHNKNPKSKSQFEDSQILEILKGNEKINDHIQHNSNLQQYIKNFKETNKKSKVAYQGALTLGFRDFLIDRPEVSLLIEKDMKERDLFAVGDDKHEKVYDYIRDFHLKNGKGPTSNELYQTFLNFKGVELRSKMNVIKKQHPEYYFNN